MNYKQAFALGLISPGAYAGEPIAYLYNGVQLPALPEWDKTVYPYAYVMGASFKNDDGTRYYWLLLSTVELNLWSNGYILDEMFSTTDGEYIRYSCRDITGTEWTSDNTVHTVVAGESFYVTNNGELAWTNHDVLDKDGTLYLAATDPIPVYA